MGLKVFWTQFVEDKLKDIYDCIYNKAGRKVPENLDLGIVSKTIHLEKPVNWSGRTIISR